MQLDANQIAALIGRGPTSVSKDEHGVLWVWAGHDDGTEPGDGTRECDQLVTLGLLGPVEVTDGFRVYPVTAAGRAEYDRLRQ